MTREQAMTATVDELRDWLAVDDGWEPYTASNDVTVWHRGEVTVNYEVSPHPHPPTLDGAAAAMPKGWDWWKVTAEWAAQAAHTPMIRIPDTGDEIADRYRLAVLCRLAEREVLK